MKRISLLGSTGTIGLNTLSVVKKFPDKLQVVCLVADNNWKILAEQIKDFKPEIAVINNKSFYNELKKSVGKTKTKILVGNEGIKEASCYENADIVVSAISGISGIFPTYYAITKGKFIALANKESLVSGGEIIKKTIRKTGATIVPVDSEHSAIFQILNGKNKKEINKIIIPASGGPFIDYSFSELDEIDIEKALKHPVWKMGKKISIDSATLANKGLEIIEAHYLFGLDYSKISVLIHRQCIVHGMVEMKDGSIFAHLGYPDMKLPIAYALFYPERISASRKCNIKFLSNLTFEEVDTKKFPFIELAYEVGRKGLSYPAVFNTADDLAVNEFLKGRIKFTDIYRLVRDVIEIHEPFKVNDINDILEVESWTRKKILEKIRELYD